MIVRLRTAATLVTLAAVGGLASGCETGQSHTSPHVTVADDFGRAVNQDLSSQITDNDPATEQGPPAPTSGQKTALAQARYNTDAVKPPPSLNTSDVSVGGGGGGGGGGSGGGGGGSGP